MSASQYGRFCSEGPCLTESNIKVDHLVPSFQQLVCLPASWAGNLLEASNQSNFRAQPCISASIRPATPPVADTYSCSIWLRSRLSGGWVSVASNAHPRFVQCRNVFGQNHWAFEVPECQSLRACSLKTYRLYPAEQRVLLETAASTWGLQFNDHESYGDFVAVLKEAIRFNELGASVKALSSCAGVSRDLDPNNAPEQRRLSPDHPVFGNAELLAKIIQRAGPCRSLALVSKSFRKASVQAVESVCISISSPAAELRRWQQLRYYPYIRKLNISCPAQHMATLDTGMMSSWQVTYLKLTHVRVQGSQEQQQQLEVQSPEQQQKSRSASKWQRCLQYLLVEQCELNQLAGLRLSNLRSFTAQDCTGPQLNSQVQGILACAPKLQAVSLRGMRLTDSLLAQLGSLPHLAALELTSCHEFEADQLHTLSACTALTSLKMVRVGTKAAAQAPSAAAGSTLPAGLRVLVLDHVQGGVRSGVISRCTRLQHLELRKTLLLDGLQGVAALTRAAAASTSLHTLVVSGVLPPPAAAPAAPAAAAAAAAAGAAGVQVAVEGAAANGAAAAAPAAPAGAPNVQVVVEGAAKVVVPAPIKPAVVCASLASHPTLQHLDLSSTCLPTTNLYEIFGNLPDLTKGAGNGDVAATCVVGGSSSSRSQASRARTLAATGLPETKPAAIAADSSSGSSKVQHVGFGPVFGCLDEALMAALVVNHPHLQFLELHRAVQYSKGALKPLQRLRSFHSLRVPVRDNVALLDIAERKQLQQLSLAVTRDVSMPGMAPLITIGPQLRAVTVAPACHERTYLKCGTKQGSACSAVEGLAQACSRSPEGAMAVDRLMQPETCDQRGIAASAISNLMQGFKKLLAKGCSLVVKTHDEDIRPDW